VGGGESGAGGAHLAVAVGRDGRQGGSRQVQPVLERSLALRPQMGPAPGQAATAQTGRGDHSSGPLQTGLRCRNTGPMGPQ
jgi:hypothetical protein